MKSVLMYRLPRFEMPPRIERPPVLYWRGTSPSQAPKSRPRSKASPVPMAATTAVEISGPTPSTLISRRQLPSPLTDLLDLLGDRLDALVEPEPVFVEPDDQIAPAWNVSISARRLILRRNVILPSVPKP